MMPISVKILLRALSKRKRKRLLSPCLGKQTKKFKLHIWEADSSRNHEQLIPRYQTFTEMQSCAGLPLELPGSTTNQLVSAASPPAVPMDIGFESASQAGKNGRFVESSLWPKSVAMNMHALLTYMMGLAPSFSFIFTPSAILSVLSLYRSENKSKCGRITIEYFTSSFMQSTRRSWCPLGINLLLLSFLSSAIVNCVSAIGMELWFGIVNMRIHFPRIRSEFTVLKDWESLLTWTTASVRPCVGRTKPVDKDTQSIWVLNTVVCTWMAS